MRLTKTSDSFGGMVWFRSQDRNDLWLEPCEMTAHDSRRAIDELSAYEDAEEQGRLVRLPYAVGDTFWAIAYSEPRVIHVRLYQITNHYEQGYILWVENIDKEMDWWKLPLREFEEWSHFASKEEAEAKLREVEHG